MPWLVAAALVLVGAGWVLHIRVWLIAVPLLVLAVVLALGRDLPPARRFALLLLALALAIVMGVELVRQQDDLGRMNTVFKFYLQAWTLFGVTTAYGLATWAPRALGWRPVGAGWPGRHRRAVRPGDALPGLRGAGQGPRSLLGRGVAARAGRHGLYGQAAADREQLESPGGRQGGNAVDAATTSRGRR